jgi:glucose-1-phosphate thymidylyltransferase
MNVIIPMAGRGSRLRPHTLTVPKPLVPVGGKPIVHRLVDDIAAVCAEKIEKIAEDKQKLILAEIKALIKKKFF